MSKAASHFLKQMRSDDNIPGKHCDFIDFPHPVGDNETSESQTKTRKDREENSPYAWERGPVQLLKWQGV